MIILGTEEPRYKDWISRVGAGGRYNGAFYYAKEIEENILSKIKCRAVINTVGIQQYAHYEIPFGSAVVVHQNVNPLEVCGHVLGREVIFVCSRQEIADIFISLNEKAVVIPLSIDRGYISKFKRKKKTKNLAFVGNIWRYKKPFVNILKEEGVDILTAMPREKLLKEMSKYKKVIAEGRCAMEASVLGCEIELPEYAGLSKRIMPEVLDNSEVIELWREVLAGQTEQYKEVEMLSDVYPFGCKGDTAYFSETKIRQLRQVCLNRNKNPMKMFRVKKEITK